MSDSEEDYMSDKILMECQEDMRPTLLFNRGKRVHEMFKRKEDARCKRHKPTKVIEREVREEGLNTAISSENKGFKLLEKMGFKTGDTLGKSSSGLREPINIVVKQGTSGLGREAHQQEIFNIKKENTFKKIREIEHRFLVTNKEKSLRMRLRKDFFKAQRICEELDFRINIPNPIDDFYWTKTTIKKRRKEEKQNLETDEEDEEDSDDEEFENYITEDNLHTLINYLRKIHLHCIYCIMTGTNEEDLLENCPGPHRIDHDPEYD